MIPAILRVDGVLSSGGMMARSPILNLPMVDARCSMKHFGVRCSDNDSYHMVGSCENCHSRVVGLFTVEHEAFSGWRSPRCPVCQCSDKLYWKGLEDTAE